VIDERIDRLVEGRFTSGMMIGQQGLPAIDRVTPFYDVEAARNDPRAFYAWLDREKPDVVFTLYRFVRRLVEARGLKVPRDIGLLQLERRAEDRDWAGMDQHNDRTGEAAVDMVISHLHNNECGVPEFPRATLIGASWLPGKTVKRVRKPATAKVGAGVPTGAKRT
jgi:LacI family transcriptional regulator